MSEHKIMQYIKTDTNIILSLLITVEFISYIKKKVWKAYYAILLNSQFLNVIKF